jgi:hypothetical protein
MTATGAKSNVLALAPAPKVEPVRSSGLKITVLAVFCTHVLLALAFAVGKPLRFSGTAWDTAKQIMPIHHWAIGFALLGATLAATWHHRYLLIAQLITGMMFYLWWASMFAWSIHTAPSAALTGPVLWGFCGISQLGSASSLIPPRRRR